MKRILILVMLAIVTLQSSAQTWPSNYTRLNSNYYWRMGAFDALNLPTRDTSLLTGQWVKAGSIIFDSTQAAGSRVWVYNGTYWERLGAGGEGFVSIGAENGLTAVNDSTVKLGGTLTENTTIDADGFNFFITNGADFRVYGSGSYSDDRLIQTSGASGIAQMGRGDGAPYYEASDSLREVNLGIVDDTNAYKIQVINPGTGAKAYAPWIGSSSEVGTITASSSTSLTLSSTETYVFTGSTNATWTLPALGTTGRRRFIKNRGTAILTVQRGGSDQLFTNTTATSMNLLSGDAAIFQDDGTYWIVM